MLYDITGLSDSLLSFVVLSIFGGSIFIELHCIKLTFLHLEIDKSSKYELGPSNVVD